MTRVSKCTPLALALAALAPGAWAQSVTPPSLAASGAGVLPTVTVTAERTTANVKDVPSSVSTLSGEKLDVINSSGEDVRAISGRVPSLNIESSFGRAFPRFYIRGYGNTDFHLNASQPVSLIYDDVVQENPILKGFPIFDLDRVEVLAGPQGTLFGRNTPAGVVKFDSVRPGPLKEGYFNASYGRFGTRNLEGAYTLPLGPEWSSRLSLQSQHRDDWVNNFSAKRQNDKLEGYDDTAGRLQLLYKPSTTFEALFNLHGRTLDGTARVFRANIIKPKTNDFVDGFNPSTVFTDGKNDQQLNTGGGSARLRWKLGDYALNSITGYEHVTAFSRGDIDGGFGASYAPPFGPGFIPFASESSDALKAHRQLSQEFRIESLLAGPFQWQAGLYYFYEKFGIDSLSYDTLFGGPTTTVQAHQKNDAYAIFGSASYAVTKQFTVKGGLRYTKDKKSLGTNSADTAIDTSGGLYRKTDDGKLNYDVSALYAVTPDANLYARIATGFRASSIYPASAFGPLTSAAPETNTSYEIGAKADLLDKRARGSVSLFPLQRQGPAAQRRGRQRQQDPAAQRQEGHGPGPGAQLRRLRDRPAAGDPERQLQHDEDQGPEPARGRVRGLHGDRPDRQAGQRADGGHHRRQFVAAGAALHRQHHRPLWLPGGGQRRVLRLYRLVVSQQGQLLPLRIDRVHRQVAHHRRPARGLPVGERQVRGGRLRPQHHQPEAHRRRHRFRQPHRLHQRATHLRRAVQDAVLSPPAPRLTSARRAASGSR